MNIYKLSFVALAAMTISSECFADSIIYAMNAGSSGIQVYDANKGTLMQTIVTPEMQANNGRGVVRVGDILYYTEASTNSVFEYNLKTNTDLHAMFTVPGATGLATMAFDGKDLYLGDYSGTSNVYKYSLSGTLLKTLPLSQCTGYCDGLEYAQGVLVSNETDGGYGRPSSYDKYSTTGTLMQKGFITTTFGASGIGFDGSDYWVSDIFGGKLDEFNTSGKLVGVTTLANATNAVEDLSFDYSAVLNPGSNSPEPGTLTLLAAGLIAVGVSTARRRKV